MEKESTDGLKEGYKCVKKTKDKIGLIHCCVVLPKQRETRGDRYGDKEGAKAQRNAVNPTVTELSSGERKEEFLCAAGEQKREGGRGKRLRGEEEEEEGDRQMEKGGENAGVAEGI